MGFWPYVAHRFPDMPFQKDKSQTQGRIQRADYLPNVNDFDAVLHFLWQIFRAIRLVRGEATRCRCSSSHSFLFCAGRSTVLTPARRAPMSFSLTPPTAVIRPRREISPWLYLLTVENERWGDTCRHCHSRRDGLARKQRDKCNRMGNSSGRAILNDT